MNTHPQSTDVARHLQPWEKQCIHDICDICREEGIPLSFGMPYFHILRNLYKVAYDATGTRLENH